MANWPVVERARVVYCTGFFITVSPEAIRKVAAHCAENDKIFAMVRMHECMDSCQIVKV